MQSTISWLDVSKKIVLVESHGMWNGADLLETTTTLLEDVPTIIIWDPTHIILSPELLTTHLDDISPERQRVYQNLVEILSRRNDARLIVVRRRSIPMFDALQNLYQEAGIDDKTIFCESQEEALRIAGLVNE